MKIIYVIGEFLQTLNLLSPDVPSRRHQNLPEVPRLCRQANVKLQYTVIHYFETETGTNPTFSAIEVPVLTINLFFIIPGIKNPLPKIVFYKN